MHVAFGAEELRFCILPLGCINFEVYQALLGGLWDRSEHSLSLQLLFTNLPFANLAAQSRH